MATSEQQPQNFDLVVIGGGSGGLTAAEFGAKLGAKVALVESSERLGGECLHAGCVPSKAFIHAARRFQTVKEHLQPWDELSRDSFAKAMQAVRDSITSVETDHDNKANYESMGVTVFNERAKFIGKQAIELTNGQHILAKRFIIATGSKPFIPAIPGLAETGYITNETIFDLEQLPTSLVVIGGGPIGCELGQAMAMFGSDVTIVTHDDRLLPRDEPEASAALQASLEQYPNVHLVFSASITNLSKNNESIDLHYAIGDEQRTVTAEKVLVATGRQANTNLGLEAAGVTYDERAITTNAKMQTSNKRIYAVGDVMGGPNFTHVAVDQAVIATQQALLGRGREKRANTELSWATFTTPEIAHVGADEASLLTRKTDFQKHILPYGQIDKAVTDQEPGQVKILTDKDGLILGATVIGGPASEMIGLLAYAKHEGKTLQSLGGAIQPYPTYNFGLRLFANGVTLSNFEKSYKKRLANIYRKLFLK